MSRCLRSSTCRVIACGLMGTATSMVASTSAFAADCAPPAPDASSYTANGCDGTVSGGTFDTGTSNNAAVLHAVNSGSITVTGPVTLHSAGNESTGAYANNGGVIRFDAPGSALTMLGAHSNGVHAFGSATVSGQLAISTSGERAHAAFLDYGGIVQLHDSTIETHGPEAAGAAVATGRFELLGASSITTTGELAPGLALTSGNSNIVVDGQDKRIAIRTSGRESFGVAGDAGTGTILLRDVDIATGGDVAAGIFARGAVTVQAERTTVSTSGYAAGGVAVGAGGAVTLAGGAVTTKGLLAHGLLARGANSRIVADGTSIMTSGDQSVGLQVIDGGQIVLRNGAVATTGVDASALNLFSSAGGTLQQVEIVASTLTASRGSAISVLGGAATISITDSTVSGPLLLGIDGRRDPIGVSITATASTLRGISYVAPAEGGQPHAARLTLRDGSTWWVTGRSNLTRLDSFDSAVNFEPPKDGQFHTLTLRQYNSSGGTLGLTGVLDGDDSPADRLVIDTGTVSGTTGVRVVNVGGKGALTSEGIRVIEVVNGGSAPAGTFMLSGRAVAGPFEYQLYRGGLQNPDDGNWYLRSQRLPDPPVPPSPPSPLRPQYRPEVPAYIANEHAAASLFLHSLHDRMGELRFSNAPAGWVRLVGKTGESGSRGNDYSARADTVVLQGGADFARMSLLGATDRLHVGAMFGYGHVQTDGLAAGNQARATGEVNGYGAGIYATWFGHAASDVGPYVDSWLQYVWFDNTVRGEQLPRVGYHSQAWNVSLETGWALPLASLPWRVEPQAQLVWLRHRGVNLTEPNGTQVNGGDTDGVVTRLGVRIFRTLERENGGRLQPYATLNWWHDQASASVAFSDHVLGQLYPRDRYELKLGLDARVARGWTSWGNIGGQWGSQGFRQYGMRLGLRYAW